MPAISRLSDFRIAPVLFGLLLISFAIISLAVVRPSSSEPGYYSSVPTDASNVRLLNPEELCQYIGYPELAKNAGIEGMVKLCVKVSHTGVITDLEVLQSDHPLLEIACVEKLHYGHFRPAISEQIPVSRQIVVNFTFDATRSCPLST